MYDLTTKRVYAGCYHLTLTDCNGDEVDQCYVERSEDNPKLWMNSISGTELYFGSKAEAKACAEMTMRESAAF